jgi:hypothetical protein
LATAATRDTDQTEIFSRSRLTDNQDIAAAQAATTIAIPPILQIIKAEINNNNGPHYKARSEPEWQLRTFYTSKTSLMK